MSIDEIPRQLGRYVLYDRIATGGMATVHFARMRGAIGFSRLVAIKRLRPNFANDAHFVQMFLDEARLAARLEHPNVVSTIDVVADDTEVFLVMEHVLGDSLEALMRDGVRRIPISIISAIICGVLEGLHFAHEARGDDEAALEIVHRDVSPHNILVGVDGVARVFDFGIAKASTNTQETREGVVKGKVAYMAPEQVRGLADRRADVYAAGVILWELIAGRRRHAGERNDSLFLKLARNELEPPRPPSTIRVDCPVSVDDIVARATHPSPEHRFASAREMAMALEAAVAPAPARDVGEWIRTVAGTRIERAAGVMRRIEATDNRLVSESKLSTAPGSVSSSSVHVVTASIRPSDSAAGRSVSVEQSRSSERPSVPSPSRSWTMVTALLAFSAALLLVGLRALSNRRDESSTVHDAAVSTAALPAALEAPAVAEESPPATLATTAPAASTTSPVTSSLAAAASSPPAVASSLPAVASSSPVSAPASSASSGSSDAKHTAARSSPPVVQPRVVRRESPREPPPPPPRPEPPPAPATAGAGHKPGCESPFAIGPDGIRQIKPECM